MISCHGNITEVFILCIFYLYVCQCLHDMMLIVQLGYPTKSVQSDPIVQLGFLPHDCTRGFSHSFYVERRLSLARYSVWYL